MPQDLEELVLSGALFSTDRSSSPVRSPSRSRSPSPDPLWPTNGHSTDSDLSLSPSGSTSNLQQDVPQEVQQSIGMGSGRPGVKGVIKDRNEAISREQAQRAQNIKDTNRRMEKMALTARTYTEDEEVRLREKAGAEGLSEKDAERGRRMFERAGRFGHLREVGEAGYVEAVEGEMNGTWVLVHLYDPSLARCHDFDAVLARLARQHPETKFLRARAGAVDFASLSSPEPTHASTSKSDSNLITIREKSSYSDDDDDDPYLYDGEEEQGHDGAQSTTDVDVLPTLLAYRSGQLVHAWVRVDWEAEAWTKRGEKNSGTIPGGFEALLREHYIIQPSSNGNCGFSSDEDDLDLKFALDGGVDDDELFDL